MNTIKDRNSKDLTEADYIKKRWQEYTEELYEKDLQDLPGEISITSDMQMTPPLWQKVKKN